MLNRASNTFALKAKINKVFGYHNHKRSLGQQEALMPLEKSRTQLWNGYSRKQDDSKLISLKNS